jgi:RimJ/RimL family protein N-acetyltransferase
MSQNHEIPEQSSRESLLRQKMNPPLELSDSTIILRTPTQEDNAITLKIMNDRSVMAFLLNNIPSSGFTLQMIEERRKNHLSLQTQGLRLQFTILKDGVNVGMCGLTSVDLQNRNGYFGIILDEHVWGVWCLWESF